MKGKREGYVLDHVPVLLRFFASPPTSRYKQTSNGFFSRLLVVGSNMRKFTSLFWCSTFLILAQKGAKLTIMPVKALP
jgi:hypothetical protein